MPYVHGRGYVRDERFEKICACGCRIRFMPERNFQKFLNDEHRVEYYKELREITKQLRTKLSAGDVQKLVGSLG